MKIIFITCMITAVTVCQAMKTDVKKFFTTTDNEEKKYSANKVYPQGKLFPFSFYSTGGGYYDKNIKPLSPQITLSDQKKIIAAGVTMIGPQYELDEQILADARKYKVKAVYTIDVVIDGVKVTKKYLEKLWKEKKELDLVKVRLAVKKIIEEIGNDSSIAWWNIGTEELRYWRKQEMAFLKCVSSAIREFDPHQRPIYMYDPGHINAMRLTKSGQYTDIIGKGMYTNYSGMKNCRIFCRWTIDQELKAIKLLKTNGKIPIAVPEMFQQPKQEELPMIESWVRHDVYSAIAAGAKGVLVFSARRRNKFSAWEKYLDSYLRICRELQGELGQAVLFGKRKKDLSFDIIQGPKSIKIKVFNHPEEKYSPICFLNLAYKNKRYLILTNSSEKSIFGTIDDLVYGSGITVEEMFCENKTYTAPEGQIELKLKPLEVKILKVYNAK